MKRNNINQLWAYEQEAVQALVPDAITKCRLDLSTGGGSVICREVIRTKALEAKRPIAVVVYTPRLLLNKQWIIDCNEYLNKKHSLSFNFINVSSDNVGEIGTRVEQALYKINGAGVLPVLSTTKTDDVVKRVNRLLRGGFNVLIVSTYHSNQVILNSGLEFNIAIDDECQFLPSGKSELLATDDKDFFEATKTKAKKTIYTTATPKYTPSDRGRGMNNIDVYGPVVYTKSPRDLIEVGAIVKPYIHLVSASPELEGILNVEEDIVVSSSPTVNERSYNLQADMIYQAFRSHSQAVSDQSVFPEKIGAKMLVVCRGSGNMRGIFESRRFKELRRQHPGIKIYGLCVDWGIEFDGHHYKMVTNRRKEEFLESVWNMNQEDKAIIFHVDMIGVGLDVPMLTGVMFMRHCDTIKFQQNIGRAARLHPEDRMHIESGELQVGDYANYIKPQYYVIIPGCFEDREDFYKQYRDWLVELRSNYGWDPSSTILPIRTQPAPIDDADDLFPPHMRGITQEDIEIFYHRIEHDELADEQACFADEFLKQLKSGSDDILKVFK